MVIFNRSHYEDVLVVRVHELVPEKVWKRRYEHIRGFEQMLADEGTVVVKLFLHISKDEQRDRLQERLDNPAKHWKFEHGDISERAHWDDYTDGLRGRDLRDLDRATRRGTSCPPTASGTGTWWCRSC